MLGGPVSGDRVTFIGDALAAAVRGVVEVRTLIGRTPVIVGGLAVLSRLSNPFRASVWRSLRLSPNLDRSSR